MKNIGEENLCATQHYALVYYLFDPRDGLPRYVGYVEAVGRSLGTRLAEHCRSKKRSSWVARLAKDGIKPAIRLIERISVARESLPHDMKTCFVELQKAEKWWIAHLRSCGLADLNIADGGVGGHSEKAREFALATWAGRGREYRSMIRRKGFITLGAKGSSDAARKRAKNLGPDRLALAMQKRAVTMGPVRLSAAAQKRIKTMGPEGLSMAAQKRLKVEGPGGRLTAVLKGRKTLHAKRGLVRPMGITYFKTSDKWRVRVTENGKTKQIGAFFTLDLASEALERYRES